MIKANNPIANKLPELILPLGIIASLFVIFVPLPTAIMDVMLAANLAIAVIILLATIYVRAPIELSVFPSLLLATTLARLALNIATTRLILTGGPVHYENAAGQVIRSFGEFVAGDQIAIGLVIFAIIIIVQFVVVTKGATRISEVTARFALDAMPGRQLSIDAELNAGTIDPTQANKLRQELSASADFYGAMDGASKFVRGDAIAGVLITAVNIVGGLVVGVMAGMDLTQAAGVFTKLTIGDGLVSQLPALLISVAAAILVTRSTSASNLPRESIRQILSHRIVLMITACFLGAMAFTQLPKLPLILLAASCLIAARFVKQHPAEPGNQDAAPSHTPNEVTIDKLLASETLELELGFELIRLADPKSGGVLLPAVTRVRKRLASELGIILPKIRIRDNLELPHNEYRILVQGNPVDIGTIFPECDLAVDKGQASGPIEGAFATETTDEGQAFWVATENRAAAEQRGYAVMDPTTVLAGRVSDVADRYAPQLLTRDATNQLVEETKKTSPAIVSELIPDVLSLKQLQQILKRLVAEQVSIRPLGLILETIGDAVGDGKKETWQLAESVRQRLAPQITARHLGRSHCLKAVTLSDDLQNLIRQQCRISAGRIDTALSPTTLTALIDAIKQGAADMVAAGHHAVVCVAQEIRPVVATIVQEQNLSTAVLGSREVVGTYVESVGEISVDQLQVDSAAA